jgi:hypothetical protein
MWNLQVLSLILIIDVVIKNFGVEVNPEQTVRCIVAEQEKPRSGAAIGIRSLCDRLAGVT